MAVLMDGARETAPVVIPEPPPPPPPPPPTHRRPDGGPAMPDGVDAPPPANDGWYGDTTAGVHERTPDEMGVASFNLAGGARNQFRDQYGKTHAAAADEIINGGSDVIGFQEVQIGRTGGQEKTAPADAKQDYNEQVLVHTYLQTVVPTLDPSEYPVSSVEVKSVTPEGNLVDYDPDLPNMHYTYTDSSGINQTVEVTRTSLDENGLPTAVYNPDAQTIRYSASKDGVPVGQSMTIRRESLDENGVPMRDEAGKPVFQSGANHLPGTSVTVYNAKIDAGPHSSHPAYPHHQPTLDYTMVFGKTLDPSEMKGGGVFGNSVLLGPKNQIKRDENGAILPGQIDNQPLNDGEGKEQRAALGIRLQHEGRDVTFVNTHLSAGDGLSDQRSAEMKQLGTFARAYGGDNVVVVGDLNAKPGDGYGDDKSYTSPEDMGLELTEKDGGNDIDHILVGPNLEARDKTTTSGSFFHPIDGSDHDLVQNTIILP